MANHLIKRIYDVQNNRLITVEVSISSFSSGGDSQVTKQFHPSGKTERYYYTSEEIVPDPDSQSDPDQKYYHESYPSSSVYSLLRTNVSFGPNPLDDIDEEDIIFGIKPYLESVQYSSADLKNFGARYGLVYKNEVYQDVIDKIRMQMNRYTVDTFVVSVNRQTSLQDQIFQVTGKVLQIEASASETRGGTYIYGTKYHSHDLYDVDYYNDIIVPYKTISTANKDNVRIQADDPSLQNPAPEEVRLLTEIKDVENYYYKYLGADPLITTVVKETYLKTPFAIDKSNFRIFVMTGTGNVVKGVFIVNKRASNSGANADNFVVKTSDILSHGYTYTDYEGVYFYKKGFTERNRQEDAIQAEWGGVTLTYTCSSGLGKFDAMQSVMQIGDPSLIKQKIGDSPVIDKTKFDQYDIQMGGRIWNLDTFMTATGNGGTGGTGAITISDVTSQVNATLSSVNTSTSQTSHKPTGKNKSMNVIHSQKTTPTGQDYDSKSYVGGGISLKTFVYPDTIARVILGDTGLVKNIQTAGTFASAGELDIVAHNFYESNYLLANITITTKGMLDLDDMSDILNVEDFIVDKVTYDFAQNGTVVNGRAIID